MSGEYLKKRPTAAVKVNYDDRKGLGYGILEPQYHNPRSQNSSYPYRDPDQHAETEEQIDDDDLDAFVTKINAGYQVTDFFSGNKNNPFYFVAGNTNLSEIATATSSISPIPDLYRGREVALGGTSPGYVHIGSSFPSRTLGKVNHGTKHGFSRAPMPTNVRGISLPVYDAEDATSRDEDVLLYLKMLIKDIHDEQESMT